MSDPVAAAPTPLTPLTPETRRIAELESQVLALEAALTRRSHELRILQGLLCRRDLVSLARLSAGLPALARGAYEPDLWLETTDFTPADVEKTLTDLWRSLSTFSGEDSGGAHG